MIAQAKNDLGQFLPIKLDTLDDIFARVSPEPNSGCWLWTGTLHHEGYAIVRTAPDYKKRRVHRLAYQLAKGKIPAGQEPDHLCRTRCCVNPEHIEAVTKRVNIMRGDCPPALRARQTHCKRGHAFDEANTIRTSRGYRQCRACARTRKARELNR